LIAVDLELNNFTEHFYYSSLEVLDGVAGTSYGGPIDGGLLSAEGEVQPSDRSLIGGNAAPGPKPPGPLRVLLVFALPTNSSNSIQLRHADQVLTPQPLAINGEGPALPPIR
jgi:hypothetical protein